jgi:hypothetical protein
MQLRVILVLFRRDLSVVEIEKFLDGFGRSFLQCARVFEEHPKLYAVEVAAGEAAQWKDVLAQLPEVVWVEHLSVPTFVSDHEA